MDKLIYFLRPIGQLGPIKIGCSTDPKSRLYTCSLWSPIRLELVCSVAGTHGLERAIHKMFSEHRLHSEWFAASKDLLAFIQHCQEFGELPEMPKVLKLPKYQHLWDPKRAQDMSARYECGATLQAIASDYGLTRERVRQILKKAGVVPRHKRIAA